MQRMATKYHLESEADASELPGLTEARLKSLLGHRQLWYSRVDMSVRWQA